MTKREFDLKIKNAKPCLKTENKNIYRFAKKLTATIGAFAMSVSLMFGLAACGDQPVTPVTPVDPNPPIIKPVDPNPPKPGDDDKEKEEAAKKLAAAIETAEGFISSLQEKQNFTHVQSGVTYEYANGATKITTSDETLYYHTKDGTAYKIYNEDGKWKQTEHENIAPISDILSAVTNIEWEKLSGDNLMGSKTLDGKLLAISVKVANAAAGYTYSYGSATTSGTISKVGSTSFQIPEVTPEKEEIDWANLTSAELAEYTPVMVENIKTKLANNIQPNIGNTGVVNKIFAIDFDGYNLILGLDYTNRSAGSRLGLYSYPLTDAVCYQDLYENNFSAKSSNPGTQLITFNYDNISADNLPRVQQCFTKLANDGLVTYTGNEDFLHMATGGTGVDTTIKCGATELKLYKISNNSIKYISLNVRSDGNTKDFIKDYLLNGTLNQTYRKLSQEFEYNFTSKALYNFEGLESATAQENQN